MSYLLKHLIYICLIASVDRLLGGGEDVMNAEEHLH